jgi:hypothetical protein
MTSTTVKNVLIVVGAIAGIGLSAIAVYEIVKQRPTGG